MEPVVEIVPAAERVRQSLEPSPLWAAALAGGTVRPPALRVRPLDLRIPPYYLVDIVRGRVVTARFAIDDDGVLLEAEAVREPGMQLSPWITPAPAETNRPAPLVWKPCDQSATRLRPFFEVERQGRVAFVGVDGTTYTELTVAMGRG